MTFENGLPELEKAVKEVVARDPQLCAVSSWEVRAANAASRAVNEIHDCARSDEPDPSKVTEPIQKVLAKIAVAAAGQKYAAAGPARALDGGMVDILADQLGVSVNDPEYLEVIQRSIGEAVKCKVEFKGEVKMFAALNTFIHVDTQPNSAGPSERGVVIPTKAFKGELGFTPAGFLTSEFVQPWEVFPETEHEKMRNLSTELKQSAEFVLVELGADCDHAQDNARTRRYLLGLEVPVKFLELVEFPSNKKLRSESSVLLGPWVIDGEIKYLLVSCGRFWTWQKKDLPSSAKVKYRLRASVVSKLLHAYSSWSSRPGIIEFR